MKNISDSEEGKKKLFSVSEFWTILLRICSSKIKPAAWQTQLPLQGFVLTTTSAAPPWDLYFSNIYNIISCTFESLAKSKLGNLSASFLPLLPFSLFLNNHAGYNSLPLTQYFSCIYVPGNEVWYSCYPCSWGTLVSFGQCELDFCIFRPKFFQLSVIFQHLHLVSMSLSWNKFSWFIYRSSSQYFTKCNLLWHMIFCSSVLLFCFSFLMFCIPFHFGLIFIYHSVLFITFL